MTATYDPALCERLCKLNWVYVQSATDSGYTALAEHLRAMADQLEAAGKVNWTCRQQLDGLQASLTDVRRERDKLQAEIDAARSVLGASPAETLTQAAERVEVNCAERARERDAARWADDTRRKACEVIAAERDKLRASLDAVNDSNDRLTAEIVSMRPVVEAACAWRSVAPANGFGVNTDALVSAIDAYRAARDKAGG